MIPLKESRKLALSWPLPPSRVHGRSKPTVYASHLLVRRAMMVDGGDIEKSMWGEGGRQ